MAPVPDLSPNIGRERYAILHSLSRVYDTNRQCHSDDTMTLSQLSLLQQRHIETRKHVFVRDQEPTYTRSKPTLYPNEPESPQTRHPTAKLYRHPTRQFATQNPLPTKTNRKHIVDGEIRVRGGLVHLDTETTMIECNRMAAAGGSSVMPTLVVTSCYPATNAVTHRHLRSSQRGSSPWPDS